MEKVLTSPPLPGPVPGLMPLSAQKPTASAEFGEMLRLSLDGHLPAGGLLSQWFDRLEGWK